MYNCISDRARILKGYTNKNILNKWRHCSYWWRWAWTCWL